MNYSKAKLWPDLGIAVTDIKRAILGGGDVSTFTPVLHEALGRAPFPSPSSLEVPLALPDTTSMLKDVDSDLFSLLSGWLEDKKCLTATIEDVEVTLVAVPPYGPYVSAYLEQVINQLQPDAVALDATPLVLRGNMLYAFSVPAAVGLPAYGEIRLKSSGKRYASEVFYPGGTNESAIIKCWLANLCR
jgi:hypothetical protein